MSATTSGEEDLRDPKKVDLWRQLAVMAAVLLALLLGPLTTLLVFLVMKAQGPRGSFLYGLLELAVSVVLLVGFVMLPIWVYRRLIGRGSATHTRSGGATAAQ